MLVVTVLLSICWMLTDLDPDDFLVPEIAHVYVVILFRQWAGMNIVREGVRRWEPRWSVNDAAIV